MSLITDIGSVIAFLGGGVLLGWLLFQFYSYRERIKPQQYVPPKLRHWSFYAAIGIGIISAWVYTRSPPVAIYFAIPAIGNAAIWFNDVWRQGQQEVAA